MCSPLITIDFHGQDVVKEEMSTATLRYIRRCALPPCERPACYSLECGGLCAGRIQLQLHFQDGQLDRPLKLLCSTFNLGNRRISSEDMSALMGDAQR